MDAFPPALQLLSRALPAGLVATLHPPPPAAAGAGGQHGGGGGGGGAGRGGKQPGGRRKLDTGGQGQQHPQPPPSQQQQQQSLPQARLELSLTGDWEAFWAAFDKDHFSARLVWTAAARGELAAALEAEERGLRRGRKHSPFKPAPLHLIALVSSISHNLPR